MPKFKAIPAVYLIFRQDDRVLLLQRKNTGYHDGDYSLVAGHVDGGEPLKGAAVREASEEVGVTVSTDDLRLVHVLHRKSDVANNENERLDFFFECTQWTGEIQNMEPEKAAEVAWFPLDNLPQNIIPNVKSVLHSITQDQIYSDIGWSEE